MADFYSNIDTTEIENATELQTGAAGKIEKFLEPADRNYVKGILGDNYSTIAGKTDTDPDYQDVEEAVIYFAVSIGLPQLSQRITNAGGFVKATGWDQSRQEVMSLQQVQRWAKYYENLAWEKLQPHIPSSSDETRLETSGFSFMSPDTPYQNK